jgi:hypothetical protein
VALHAGGGQHFRRLALLLALLVGEGGRRGGGGEGGELGARGGQRALEVAALGVEQLRPRRRDALVAQLDLVLQAIERRLTLVAHAGQQIGRVLAGHESDDAPAQVGRARL